MTALIKGQATSHMAPAEILALALYVAILIASVCQPVSLLSPIPQDFDVTEGYAGHALLILAVFAVGASLTIARMTRWIDRKQMHGARMGLLAVDRRVRGRAAAQPVVGCDAVDLAGFISAAPVGLAAGQVRRHSEVSR